MTQIDLLVGLYANANIDRLVEGFVSSLIRKCDMRDVSVFCVERACAPVSERVKRALHDAEFPLYSCPLATFTVCREDTSQFADWMVSNLGSAPWFVVSHFDVEFTNDYMGYLRSQMEVADMVGSHHNGVVAVSRDAYRKCQVGFCGVDKMCVAYDANLPRIVPDDTPVNVDKSKMLALDVGELLELRMNALRLRHVWLHSGNSGDDYPLFNHLRQGSNHA